MGDEQRDRPECRECREIVSARLDGEAGPEEVGGADAHLAQCPPCREFVERAARITRLARMAPVVPGPDLTDAVAAALDAAGSAAGPSAGSAAAAAGPTPGPRTSEAQGADRMRRRLPDLVRLGLGGVAAGQVALVVSGVVAVGQAQHGGGQLAGASSAHLVHESSAWNLALGVAFAVVAASRTRPAGLVPVVGAFLGLLGLLSVLDVLSNRVDPGRLVGHVPVLAGFLLLLLLWCLDRDGRGDAARPAGVRGAATGVPGARARRRARRRPGVAPAGRRVA
ncbi:zf-HC2 domain-containing protein [Pseudonocardia sp.]|uniref:zf-HC2 domain-containing protein n=1 Tax=Pseudonocardia sp. TaxID=60912 RepID=UPI003D12BE02